MKISQHHVGCHGAQVLAIECMDLVVTNICLILQQAAADSHQEIGKNQLQLDFQTFQGFIHLSQYWVHDFSYSDKSDKFQKGRISVLATGQKKEGPKEDG